MTTNFTTPILFIIFRRPETTARVFAKIKKIKPAVLYIAADGPRKNKPDEINLCNKTRALVEKIDWRCDIKRLYRKNNLGLRRAIPDALNWFFKTNSMGIILEDDCLPDDSFFWYCQEQLIRYKHDTKVMHIGGTNFLNKDDQDKNSYYFTKFPHVWGWATWRRAWKKYDYKMNSFPKDFLTNRLGVKFESFWEKSYWFILFKAVKEGKIDTWDYQWVYTTWKNNGISINPGVNLISNLGFGNGAVNTKRDNAKFSKMPTSSIVKNLQYIRPKINQKFDSYTANIMFNSNPLSVIARWIFYQLLA